MWIKQGNFSVQKSIPKANILKIENRYSNAIDIWQVWTGNELNKPILPLKLDQVNRYEWYNRQTSLYCFQLYAFWVNFWPT